MSTLNSHLSFWALLNELSSIISTLSSNSFVFFLTLIWVGVLEVRFAVGIKSTSGLKLVKIMLEN